TRLAAAIPRTPGAGLPRRGAEPYPVPGGPLRRAGHRAGAAAGRSPATRWREHSAAASAGETEREPHRIGPWQAGPPRDRCAPRETARPGSTRARPLPSADPVHRAVRSTSPGRGRAAGAVPPAPGSGANGVALAPAAEPPRATDLDAAAHGPGGIPLTSVSCS